MTSTNRRKLLAVLIAMTMMPALHASAQDFPSKPIRIIAPQAAGGPNDLLARMLADQIKDTLGQPVIVENKPGVGGMLAAEAVAKSPPDGHTLLLTTASLIYGAHLTPNPPINPLKDLAPVAMVTFTPLVLASNVESLPSVKTFPELIAYAKANPGKLNIGVSAVGGSDHLMAEMINRRADVKIEVIAYKGAAPATQDLVAGRVQLEATTYGFLKQYIEKGTLRVLASPNAKRNPFAPDAPTIAELGYPGLDVPTWTGFMAPAGTPKAVIDKLAAAFRSAMSSKGVLDKLVGLSLVANYAEPDQFGTILIADSDRMLKVIRDANIKLQ